MKMLCVIFSLLVVLLSVSPCCTDNNCDNVVKKEHAAKNKASDCSGCSPFFSCGSCTGFTLAKMFSIKLALAIANYSKAHTPYHQPAIKEISLSIWQPPQLS